MLRIEQNDEWLVGRSYLSHESLTALAIQGTERSARAVLETEQSQSQKKENGNGKRDHCPRRLRAQLTDEYELHHETRLDSPPRREAWEPSRSYAARPSSLAAAPVAFQVGDGDARREAGFSGQPRDRLMKRHARNIG